MTAEAVSALLPLHLGALHPYEQVLVIALAFGPFVILALVVYVIRRRDLARDDGVTVDPARIDNQPAGEQPADEPQPTDV